MCTVVVVPTKGKTRRIDNFERVMLSLGEEVRQDVGKKKRRSCNTASHLFSGKKSCFADLETSDSFASIRATSRCPCFTSSRKQKRETMQLNCQFRDGSDRILKHQKHVVIFQKPRLGVRALPSEFDAISREYQILRGYPNTFDNTALSRRS